MKKPGHATCLNVCVFSVRIGKKYRLFAVFLLNILCYTELYLVSRQNSSDKDSSGGSELKIFFSDAAIDKLKEISAFQNICFTTTRDLPNAQPGITSLVIRSNETDFSKYEQVLETHIGTVRADKYALRILGSDNKIDFDRFRNVLILIVDGDIVDDNLYLDILPQ